MRQATIKQALGTAFGSLPGVTGCEVRDVAVRKGRKANGGAVKLVDATIVVAEGADRASIRVTNVATESLRDTPAARKALRRFAERVGRGPGWKPVGDAPKVEAIRDIARGGEAASGPVCGSETSTGDPCQRPSADGTACWQHGGDAARKGLVARNGGNVRTHKPGDAKPSAGAPNWEDIARVAAEAAARAAVEAIMSATR